ncbi:TetR/AcrR family transcriptional regulator [Actinopolymorpha sp. B17G11]|uniref:TetR/AcrR family transcriptional regulator n=1 Tax=Actinopolymorpha sp. B17G11 TaxID=3160861 RepID=UPI0032E4AAB7
MGRPTPTGGNPGEAGTTGPDVDGAASGSRRPSRRDQRRQELLADIGTATRELVVIDGPPAVTMAAVADRLGVTAPALYRYVNGRTGLLDLACASVIRELAAALIAHRDSLGTDPLARALGVCREFRRWSLAHRAECSATFSHRATRFSDPSATPTAAGDEAVAAQLELAWVIEEALLLLWAARPFDVGHGDDALPERLRAALGPYRSQIMARAVAAGHTLEEPPLGATAVLLDYWTRIYGLVSMEVFGHLAHAMTDAEPLFEAVLDDLSALVGQRR